MTSISPHKSLGATLWKVLLAGYVFVLVTSTHLPPSFPLLPRNQTDKLAHFLAYTVLAWLLAMAWQASTGWLNGRHLRFVWLAIIAFAALDEVTQPMFGRTASIWDWLADAAGAALGILLFALIRSGLKSMKFDKFKS
jgi:VanZ family protein